MLGCSSDETLLDCLMAPTVAHAVEGDPDSSSHLPPQVLAALARLGSARSSPRCPFVSPVPARLGSARFSGGGNVAGQVVLKRLLQFKSVLSWASGSCQTTSNSHRDWVNPTSDIMLAGAK